MDGRTPLYLTLLLVVVLATVLLVAQPYSYRSDPSDWKADTAPVSYFLQTVLHHDSAAAPGPGEAKMDNGPGTPLP